MKLAGKVALPPGVSTVTSTTPGACAGVRTVTAVLLTGASSVAVKPPKATEYVPLKLVPVSVTVVKAVPVTGESALSVGAVGVT